MIAAHSFFATLAPAAVFEALRYIGAASANPRGQGLIGLAAQTSRLTGAPASVEIARLMLHLAWENQGRHNSTFSFYLFANRMALQNIGASIQPNTSGWIEAATNILYKMPNDISITYANNSWDIECVNNSLRLVPEIRQIIDQIRDKKYHMNIKDSENVIVGSTISSGGGSLNIGSTHNYYYGQPPIPTPETIMEMIEFKKRIYNHLNSNQLIEAFAVAMVYTQIKSSHRYVDLLNLSKQFETLSQKWSQGELSDQVAGLEWHKIKLALSSFVAEITTLV